MSQVGLQLLRVHNRFKPRGCQHGLDFLGGQVLSEVFYFADKVSSVISCDLKLVVEVRCKVELSQTFLVLGGSGNVAHNPDLSVLVASLNAINY